MSKYNLKSIMSSAWSYKRSLKKKGIKKNIGYCLKKAWADAKTLLKAITENAITEAVATWYGWALKGREVIHDHKCVLQIVVEDLTKKSGTAIKSYFKLSDTCEFGTQD